jgi:putative SOS response-associated peptidase YedK
MCGRYTLRVPVEKLGEEFSLEENGMELQPRYNIAPTQEVAAVLETGGRRHLELLRWGLIPAWADDPAIGSRLINARAETAPEKPSFRSAFKNRRCLVVADGFYEWKREADGKQPYYVRMERGRPFAFAGLWESWTAPDGEEVRSCAIITTEANRLMAPIHNRMPVILPPDHYSPWLDEDLREAEPLRELLRPYERDDLEAYAVSRHVNRPANDDEGCVEPL